MTGFGIFEFMNRTERLELVVRLLRDRPGITAGEVADRLEVGVRSVFRDLETLRERGYPISASRGRGGGLQLHPNWGVGRILFAAEEAIGMLLSVTVAESVGLPLFAQNWSAIRTKLVAAFPDAERRRLKQLRDRILVGPAASAPVRASYGIANPAAARGLQSAFIRSRAIEFDYEKSNGERSRRRIEPHAILLNLPAWYVLGYDEERADVRTFRLDRISSVTVSTREFKPRPKTILRAIGDVGSADPDRWSL